MADQPAVDQRTLPRTATSNIEFADFGGPTTIRSTRPIAGVQAIEVLQNNAERTQFILVNCSAQVLTVDWAPDVIPGRGILLAPNGGSIQMSLKKDGSTVGWSLFAIAAGAGLQLSVTEWVRYDSRG